jgi:hypothetical protein
MITGYLQYRYLEKQNEVTKLRLEIPKASAALIKIQEENERLKYKIDQFEDPAKLIQLARRPEFSYLKSGLSENILTVKSTDTNFCPQQTHFSENFHAISKKQPLFLGAKHQ